MRSISSCRPTIYFYRFIARNGTPRQTSKALRDLAFEYERLRGWTLGSGLQSPKFYTHSMGVTMDTAWSGREDCKREKLLDLATAYGQLREWIRDHNEIPPRFELPIDWIKDIAENPATDFQARIAQSV